MLIDIHPQLFIGYWMKNSHLLLSLYFFKSYFCLCSNILIIDRHMTLHVVHIYKKFCIEQYNISGDLPKLFTVAFYCSELHASRAITKLL